MLQKIRSGKFTHLLVRRIDRISRNLVDFSELYEELQKHHVAFVSQTEQFDTSTTMGRAMLRIILTFAQLESEMTAERIHAVLTSWRTRVIGMEGTRRMDTAMIQKPKKRLNYWDLMDEVNHLILKEFLQHFVARIYVNRGTISSITFKNDFTLHFIINNPFKNFTDFFGTPVD